LNILVVHSSYKNSQPSGENRVVFDEISELQNRNIRIFRHIRNASNMRFHYFLTVITNLKVRRLKIPAVQKFFYVRQLKKNNIDLIHIHNTFPLIDFALLDAALDLKIPFIFSLHNYRFVCINGLLFREGKLCQLCTFDDRQGIAYKCYKSSKILSYFATNSKRRYLEYLRKAEKILVLNEISKNFLYKLGINENQIELKRNFIRESSSGNGVQKDRTKEILWVGRIDHAKGLGKLLAYWEKSNLPELNYKLLIAGDGPLKDELQNIYQNSNSIIFKGTLNSLEINNYYKRAAFLIVSSESFEGFPLVITEAAMNGLRVIAPKHGAFLDLEGKVAGFQLLTGFQ